MIKIIQFNARSLTRTTLTQFKAHMHQHKPHIATLSETFWKDSFEVKFKDYYVIKKNRQGLVGGGVAILVHKSVEHTTIALPHLSTIEATAISIFVDGNRTGRELMIISLYIPDGSKCNEEDLDILANASDNTILSGDFNAHHERWQGGCRHPNRSGSLIAGLLDRLDHLTLATPKDLGTRQCYNSFTTSTIDLTIMPPYLAATSKITRGPDLGSDHFPIHIEIGVQATKTGNRVPRWILKDADWITWNTQISGRINNSEFYSSQDSEVKYLILREAMIQSAQHSNIRMSKPNQQISAHSTNPWWNEKCKAAVAKARRAKNACDSKKGGICCVTNKTIWRRLDNEKKRIIKEEKENTFNIFINNLNPRCSTTKTWAFVKSMVAKAPPPDYNSSPIKNPDNNELVTTQKEKAEIFAKQYNYQKENLPDNQHYEQLINVRTNSQVPNALNSPILEKELEYGLKNLKSNAMGKDKIHNLMIRNLSPSNRRHVLHLMNHMLRNKYVPADWKQATIIPIIKPGKPTDQPESYRPISLTLCLGKVMERIINQRLSWYLENKRCRLRNQSGFRKGRSTIDNILSLE